MDDSQEHSANQKKPDKKGGNCIVLIFYLLGITERSMVTRDWDERETIKLWRTS